MRRNALFSRAVSVTVLALVLSACGTDAPSSVAPAGTPAAGSSGSGAAESSTGSTNGLEWTAVEFGCDVFDDVEARGRVTNTTSSGIGSASFTITVLQDGRIAATLTGFLTDLDVGASKTVEFLSTDDCLDGEFTFEIQTDFSFGGSSSSGGSSAGGDASGTLEWSMLDFSCDVFDDVEARGRVENKGSRPISSAAFTLTVFQGGRIAATLTGFVDDLAVGATKTVEFFSTDDCLDGDFEYEVQTDYAFEG